jgi:16S rRNA (uracil1498-N3)-methyltransferase
VLFLPMHRFYCPQTDFSPPTIAITNSAEIHHLKNVLRLQKGDKVNIFNGQGEEICGQIEKLNETAARITVLSRHKRSAGKKCHVTLACAIPKKAKFEYIIEKATELGVDQIVPMQTARTEVVVQADRLERKNARYQAVAINAAKQSGRTIIPDVSSVTSFKEVIASAEMDALKLIPCLLGDRRELAQVLKEVNEPRKIIFLIGPEGDFTPQEVEIALKAGFVPVSLGETTLKVDTAAIVVVALAKLTI